MMTNPELIEAREVAEILQISIPSLRDYRKRGLIVVAAKRGNTDLYDKADVVRRCSIIKEKRGQGFSLIPDQSDAVQRAEQCDRCIRS